MPPTRDPIAAPAPFLRDAERLLHIGVPKTATTAIQGALAAARPAMMAQGVCYPGSGSNHYEAALAAVGKRRGWSKGGSVPEIARWERLMRAAETQDKTVISGEVFCEANTDTVHRIAGDIGPERIRVLITLRPLEELLPSTWQQYIKAGSYIPYSDWLVDMMNGPGKTTVTPSFWKRNNHGALVERWSKVVGADRVAVVMVDGAQLDGIYRSFEEVIGLTPNTLLPVEELPSNRSLSASEVEIVRQLNASVKEAVDYRLYNALVRKGALEALVEGRRAGPDEPKLFVPGWAARKARRFGEHAIDRIRATEVRVYGDLESLVPTAPPIDRDLPEVVDAPIEVSMLVLKGMLDNAVALLERDGAASADVAPSMPATVRAQVGRVARRAKREAERLRHSMSGSQ